MKNIANSTALRKAWAIRKEAAARFGVRIKFVSWGDCLRLAMGRSRRQPRDCYGFPLGSELSMVNEAILDDDAPLVVFSDDVADYLGMEPRLVRRQLKRLVDRGYATETSGWLTLKLSARPYQQAA